jgi:hypothetical protein
MHAPGTASGSQHGRARERVLGANWKIGRLQAPNRILPIDVICMLKGCVRQAASFAPAARAGQNRAFLGPTPKRGLNPSQRSIQNRSQRVQALPIPELVLPREVLDIMGFPFLEFTPEEKKALVLSTFAGLSTTIGAIFAVSPG